MTWSYRIVKYADGSGFGIHEVYYCDDGEEISTMTKDPIWFVGDTPEDVRGSLEMAIKDAIYREVLDEP